MGQGSSKHPEYATSAALFTNHEMEQMSRLFMLISKGNDAFFNESQLQQYLGRFFPEWLIKRLYKEMTDVSEGKDRKAEARGNVKLQDFVVALAHILRGTPHHKAHSIRRMSTDNPAITPFDVLQWMQEMLRTYIQIITDYPEYSSWKFDACDEDLKRTAAAMLRDLFYKPDDKHRHSVKLPENSNYNEDMLERWLTMSPVVLHVYDVVFNTCFPISFVEGKAAHYVAPLMPTCQGANWQKCKTLLNPYCLLYLNYNMPVELHNEWRLVYHSSMHGESFATFFKNICHQGPSVIVVRDKSQNVFGGFASQSWEANHNFVGSSRCFLFTLAPHTEIFPATGLNENFMYLNSGQETLPNGLGMGGQFNYYGLYLDNEYGKGSSKAQPQCTTYGSPQLSGEAEFEIDAIEVWAVGPVPTKEDEEEHKSILDKDPEAKAMLRIIGKGPHSEGLREGDATAHMPEEHKLPLL